MLKRSVKSDNRIQRFQRVGN